MNRYEAILLDKMVDIWQDGVAAPYTIPKTQDERTRDILLLLDCICDFREPPRALDVADGYGAMVDASGEVVE